ncbi:MAG: AmmeMemoRadiSam system protein B [Caldilineaceae bacterium]|nr:AmmeMemoRadiSam system protein B [Caldilineaceae bacterium]
MTTHPKLRSLDIRPYEQNGHPYLLLRDPLQLSEQTVLAPQPLAAVLAFCDGHHSPAQMAAAFSRQYGVPVEVELVERLLAALDRAYLLDNAQAEKARQRALRAYRSAPFRPPLIAGQGYPAAPTELAPLLDGWLREATGAHAPPTRPTATQPERIGLLSPHIDYARGGAVYAQAWQAVAEEVRDADLVIAFGTDHYGSDPFTLTRQNYATPYGVLPTAQPLVDALVETIGERAAFAGELRHRGEHSLELVAVWLHHMRRGQSVDLLPVLVGSFHPFYLNGATPATEPGIQDVLDTLRRQMVGRKVVVVASGDLAHVGPAFGGQPLDPQKREQLAKADATLIDHMQRGDAEGFFSAIKRVQDRNNVCGVSPIYLTMRLLGVVSGHRAGYATCPADEQGTSVVTVAGMVFRP